MSDFDWLWSWYNSDAALSRRFGVGLSPPQFVQILNDRICLHRIATLEGLAVGQAICYALALDAGLAHIAVDSIPGKMDTWQVDEVLVEFRRQVFQLLPIRKAYVHHAVESTEFELGDTRLDGLFTLEGLLPNHELRDGQPLILEIWATR